MKTRNGLVSGLAITLLSSCALLIDANERDTRAAGAGGASAGAAGESAGGKLGAGGSMSLGGRTPSMGGDNFVGGAGVGGIAAGAGGSLPELDAGEAGQPATSSGGKPPGAGGTSGGRAAQGGAGGKASSGGTAGTTAVACPHPDIPVLPGSWSAGTFMSDGGSGGEPATIAPRGTFPAKQRCLCVQGEVPQLGEGEGSMEANVTYNLPTKVALKYIEVEAEIVESTSFDTLYVHIVTDSDVQYCRRLADMDKVAANKLRIHAASFTKECWETGGAAYNAESITQIKLQIVNSWDVDTVFDFCVRDLQVVPQ